MAEKPTIYIDYQSGKIQGPGRVIGHLFANPKSKSWFAPPEVSTIVISDAERFQYTVDRLRELGYPLVEGAAPSQGA
ncbi:hypothetical protein [Candidatus Entotheonella palauensis]|uniref:Uncharacterized protein n=1 Tax=Candidatus Entotheonella gemina TaxID=1429439 RepID=W4MBY2_9BACT|nr:hypothetical protein [Candidatus Entotheonella palauensis]ETX07416.1 MAG: hypothetical protein ETSY2_11375 [Candidatus Entotheonella gemina]